MNIETQIEKKGHSSGLMNPSHKSDLKVSVITPVYNGEKYLDDLLYSVMKQDYPNFEHIVLDDGSTDNTTKILKKYETKYQLKWISKENEGQTVTLNKSLNMIEGDLVVWINADDILFDNQVIKNIVIFFKKYSNIDVAYGHMAIIDPTNTLIKIQHAPPGLNFNSLLRGHYAACICYRKNILKKYPFDPKYNFIMDYEQCLRMAKNGIKFGFVNKIILGYRKHPETKSIAKKIEQEKEIDKFLDSYGKNMQTFVFFRKLYDYAVIELFNLLGIVMVLKIRFIPDQINLTCPVKVNPSLIKAILNQVIPFRQI